LNNIHDDKFPLSVKGDGDKASLWPAPFRMTSSSAVAPEQLAPNGLAPNNGQTLRANDDGVQDQAPEKLSWMTEAKDWAGELISGQSAIGRILVNQ